MRETSTRFWCHRVSYFPRVHWWWAPTPGTTHTQAVVSTNVLVCSHTSLLQSYCPREAPVRLSPWEPLFLSHGCWSRSRGHFPDCASFVSSILMQWSELSTNNQFQPPRLAFLWSDALYYFKGLCKHTVEKAFVISGGESQRGALCTFPKKPYCVNGLRGS